MAANTAAACVDGGAFLSIWTANPYSDAKPLSAAFTLAADEPRLAGGLVRRADEIPAWRDPDTGYLRRQVSPPRFPAAVTEVTLPAGAEAYRRDLPDAEIHLLDAGHFALETHAAEIAKLMREFLGRTLPRCP